MTETVSEGRMIALGSDYAERRAAYFAAVARATETGDEDDAAAMHHAYHDMEDAADTLMRAGLGWRAQHRQPDPDPAAPHPWRPSEGAAP